MKGEEHEKKRNRLLSLFLCAVLLTSLCSIGASAAAPIEKSPQASQFDGVPSLTLSYFERIVRADDAIKDVSRAGDTLRFSLPNGTTSQIVESIDETGMRHWFITEGEKRDTISIDPVSGEMYLNGKPIAFQMRIVSRSLGQLVTRGNGWTYFGSIYPDIQAEEAIREMTTAALLTLLIGGFQVWGMGAIGLDLSLAAIIINFFVGLNDDTQVFYAIRDICYFGDYVSSKYEDTYYTNSSYTTVITTRVTEGMGGA